MTQAEIKRSPSPSPSPGLKSIDRRERLPTDPRLAERVGGVKAAQPILPPANDATMPTERVGSDDFVFEEVGATVAPAPARESALQMRGARTTLKDETAARSEAMSAESANVIPIAAPSAATPNEASDTSSLPVAPPAAVAAVDEPSHAAAVSAGQPAATTSSAPGRDLDLRTKLNQKEAEIIALRGELSARDRQVLELNERLLEVERSYLLLNESLEHHVQLLSEAKGELRTHETEREATTKRIAEMTAAFRRREETAKRKSERELENLRAELSSELSKQAAAHASQLEQRERNHAAELERLRAAHGAATDEAHEKHATALRNLEATSSQALSRAAAAYAAKVRSLEEMHEKALTKATASHTAALEAAVSAAASEKARALGEAESAHRATQSELASAISTVQFLERTQAGHAARIARQDARIAELEDALSRATTKADAAEETLSALRRALTTGLTLLNGSSRPADGV